MNHSDLVLVGYNKGHVETSLRICGKERLMEAVELAEVMSSGSLNAWDPREIRSALHFYDFNITAAVQALHDEEVLLEHEFQEAVESMVSNGWDADVASMAVNAQWEMDQKTHTQELPQLESFESIDEDIPNESSGSVALHTRRELDVSDIALDPEIFDGDLASLQRLVIDSPVPVLLDIYADWCVPCKKLTPILEAVTKTLGGSIRLVKINADSNPDIMQVLGVEAFPTVFLLREGEIMSRFQGFKLKDEVNNFIRSVLKEPRSLEWKSVSQKLLKCAGFGCLGFMKIQKLNDYIDDLFVSELGSNDAIWIESMRTALRFIQKAEFSIRNTTHSRIDCRDEIFERLIGRCTEAQSLLKIAGFRSSESTPMTLSLVHKNSAILSVVIERTLMNIQKIKRTLPSGHITSLAAKGSSQPIQAKPTARIIAKKKGLAGRRSSSRSVHTLATERMEDASPGGEVEYFGGDSTVFLSKGDKK